MLVSIIIPTYNRCHFLGTTLDSIICQKYKEWECLVIDDGSEDFTSELMTFYIERDPRIKFYKRPANRKKGANACRNYGFKISRGKFINWFDSDDIMHHDFLKIKVMALIENENAVSCISPFQSFTFGLNETELSDVSRIGEKKIIENLIVQNYAIPTDAPLWEKVHLTGKELFDENLLISQDLDFHIRNFPPDEKVAVINQPLYFLRTGHKNITSEFYTFIDDHFPSFFEVRKRILKRFSSNAIIRSYILKELMGMFRFLLSKKDYVNSRLILDFISSGDYDSGPYQYIKYKRIYLFYYLIKLTGKGETKLKRFLYV